MLTLKLWARELIAVTAAFSSLLALSAEASVAAHPERSIFALGAQQFGLSLGYGNGVRWAGSGTIEGHRVREFIALLHWQIDITRAPLREPPAWYAGGLALRAEGTLLANFRPRSGVAGGLGLLLRYSLHRWRPWSPYVQIGAGVIGLGFDLVDQDDGLAFIPQAGVGVGYRLSQHLSLDLGWRFHHISNAFSHLPNGGIDSSQLLLGLAYQLD